MPKSTIEDENFIQAVVFHLGREEFAFDVSQVKEIIRPLPITRVPKSKPFIEGVINLRGNVISVVDLRKQLHFTAGNKPEQTRIIILETQGVTFGVIVDSVQETRQIPRETIQPPLALVSGVESEYISGVAKLEGRLISLLQIHKIVLKEQ